jgi:hypothetical protein
MGAVLLLDDERSFADGRESLVAKSVQAAITATDDLTELDELWLDFVLIGPASDEFLMHLSDRKRNGNPLTIKKVYIHTSSWDAVGLLKMYLNDLDVGEVEVVNHQDYFVS